MSSLHLLSEGLVEHLYRAAKRNSSIPEDDTVDDYAGGNVDDAYSLGVQHGEAHLAKLLVAEIEEK